MIKRILASMGVVSLLLFSVPAYASTSLTYDNEFNTAYPSHAFINCTHDGCPNAPDSYLGAEPAGNPDDSGHCTYNASKVASIANGMLDLHVQPINGKCYSVNMHPLVAPQLYGQYELRFKADNIPFYHFVVLFWPSNNKTGELDFPEANLGNPWHGFNHKIAGQSTPGSFSIYVSNANPSGWHVAYIQWYPTGIVMNLDGKNLPVQGSEPIPNTPMFVAIHLESWMGTSQRPNNTSIGDVYIDWFRIWSYNGKVLDFMHRTV